MDESVVGKRGGHFELDSKISPEVEEMTTGELEETTVRIRNVLKPR